MRRLFFFLFACAAISAETVITTGEKVQGKVLSIEDQRVVVRLASGEQVSLVKENILAIYDDEGREIWKSPTIVENDPTPELKGDKERIPLSQGTSVPRYRGLHIGLTGSYGILWPNATFSRFALGSSPDYRPLAGGQASAAWYFDDSQAVVGSLGYTARQIPIRGITAEGYIGDGYWPMDLLDVRAAYRVHSDFFFIEMGLLTALSISNAPLTVQTTNRTITNNSYTPKSYLALSFAIGINMHVTGQLYALSILRIDHAITSAVTGDAPTSTGVAGEVLSTAPIALLPMSGSIELGVAWRFNP